MVLASLTFTQDFIGAQVIFAKQIIYDDPPLIRPTFGRPTLRTECNEGFFQLLKFSQILSSSMKYR